MPIPTLESYFATETDFQLAERIREQFGGKYGDGYTSTPKRGRYCRVCETREGDEHGLHCDVRLMLEAARRLENRR